MLPEENLDEPALEPLGLTHILFPVMFLLGGLVISFLIFVVETKGLTVVLKQFKKRKNLSILRRGTHLIRIGRRKDSCS